jgi:murein tripeptide amidase MpaA
VSKVVVGKTLSKRTIEGLVICHPSPNKKKDTRKAIFVMARQHPGECQGSYVCEGVVDKLLSKTKEAEFLLKNYVVYVIPMINVDGVVFGHYRTNLSGKDLNRKWNVTER